MEQTQALAVVRSLANGVDPETGEVFPPESAYQRPQVVRALYEAATALERIEHLRRFGMRRELACELGARVLALCEEPQCPDLELGGRVRPLALHTARLSRDHSASQVLPSSKKATLGGVCSRGRPSPCS